MKKELKASLIRPLNLFSHLFFSCACLTLLYVFVHGDLYTRTLFQLPSTGDAIGYNDIIRFIIDIIFFILAIVCYIFAFRFTLSENTETKLSEKISNIVMMALLHIYDIIALIFDMFIRSGVQPYERVIDILLIVVWIAVDIILYVRAYAKD